MSLRIIVRALGVTTLALSLTPAFAQNAGHQMPGMAQGTGGNATTCAQNSQGVTKAIDAVNGRMEDARQSNDAGRLRAAVSDLQVALAQIKTQLADCVALGGESGGGAMGNMPGMDQSKRPAQPNAPVMQPGATPAAPAAKGVMPTMPAMNHSKMPGMQPAKPKLAAAAGPKKPEMDHSKMPGMEPAKPKTATAAPKKAEMDHSKMAGMAPAKPKPAAAESKPAEMDHSKMAMEKAASSSGAGAANAAPSSGVVVLMRTDPAPPRTGNNDFEVTVKDAAGKPIADADVSLTFLMPAMPAMRNTVKLTPAGNGAYKGSGTIGMAGDWDVTVTASRNGEQLVSKKMKLTAK